MIPVYFLEGNLLLYSVDDWAALRKTHRIIGEIIGHATHIHSLPLQKFFHIRNRNVNQYILFFIDFLMFIHCSVNFLN